LALLSVCSVNSTLSHLPDASLHLHRQITSARPSNPSTPIVHVGAFPTTTPFANASSDSLSITRKKESKNEASILLQRRLLQLIPTSNILLLCTTQYFNHPPFYVHTLPAGKPSKFEYQSRQRDCLIDAYLDDSLNTLDLHCLQAKRCAVVRIEYYP